MPPRVAALTEVPAGSIRRSVHDLTVEPNREPNRELNREPIRELDLQTEAA